MPIARFLAGPDVMRPSPDSATLRLPFTRTELRTLRRSDGTITIEGRRFEVPNRYRHFVRLEVRFASWISLWFTSSMSTPATCCAGCSRRTRSAMHWVCADLEPLTAEPVAAKLSKPAGGIAPLLAKLIEQRAAEALRAICDLDLSEIQAIVPPRGFGRD